ncbi:MAG: hypothetical protein PHQ40_12160, partial [Anaerolineaceae bacterium]|nr:hypothetical protein [Anaerolineaceae bacterium]
RWKSYRKQPDQGRWSAWRKLLRKWVIGSAIGSPVILQMVYLSLFDPFTKQWNLQSLVLSPHPVIYLAAYALVTPLAIIGLKRLLLNHAEESPLLISWLILFPVMAYLPINAQRRLPEGVWIPLAILAVTGIGVILDKKPGMSRFVNFAISPLFFSTLFLWTGGIIAVLNPGLPLFRSRSEVNAFDYFSNHDQSIPVVLSSYETGNVLPAYEPVRVVSGLGTESIYFSEVQPAVNAFYKGEMNQIQQERFLQKMRVAYVYWGPVEKTIGHWIPETSPWLNEVYDQDEIQIFRVNHR